MKSRIGILWCIVLAVVVVGLGITGHSAYRACSSAREQAEQLQLTQEEADKAVRFRLQTSSWAGAHKPSSGLAKRVGAALEASGLPASAMSGLSADTAPSSSGNGGLAQRRRAVLTLGSATLPKLGVFLNEWRARQPEWVISNLDISPQERQPVTPGGDVPLRAVIAMEALFVEDGDAK